VASNTALWLAIFPGLMIFLTVISVNFIDDGLRGMLDPRSKI
jgi:peptide/nickel transport system permease protein